MSPTFSSTAGAGVCAITLTARAAISPIVINARMNKPPGLPPSSSGSELLTLDNRDRPLGVMRRRSLETACQYTSKQFSADSIPFAVNLIRGGAQSPQHGFRHRQRDLALAGKNLLGAGTPEGRHVPQVCTTDEDVDLRIELPRHADDLG